MSASEVTTDATTQSQADPGVGGAPVERSSIPRRFRRATILWMVTTAVCAVVGLSASAIPKDWPNGWFAVSGLALIGSFPAALIAWILSRKDKTEYVKL